MVERVFLEIIFSLLLKVFTIYFEPVGRGYKSFCAVIYTPTHFLRDKLACFHSVTTINTLVYLIFVRSLGPHPGGAPIR